jgi:hypothetical protein
MKKPLSILFFLIFVFCNVKAQRPDTLDLVNHLGYIYPVKDKVTLGNGEFNRIIKSNKEAVKYLNRARWIKGAQIATEVIAFVPLAIAISYIPSPSLNENVLWALVASSAAISGIAYVAYLEPYNRNILKALKTYNAGKIEGKY